MTILVTGGTGYIGSHTCVELIKGGNEVIVLDNLSNSKLEVIDRIEAICGAKPRFYRCDLLDKQAVSEIFRENQIDAVIHFAGLKAVGESVQQPLRYYHNNVTGTLVLCEIMQEYGCRNLVFSSSATVYGVPETVPVREDFPLSATNPYGQTKLAIEQILRDLSASDPSWTITILRYFNPIGAHESGRIGEDPNGIPNNLMPFIVKVAAGTFERLNVFGNDYPTHDGTGIRDYIHVEDLAAGHVKALRRAGEPGVFTYNLGTGKGYSVLDVVRAFEKENGVTIPYQICPRRPGDIAACYADAALALRELGWKAERTMEQMCRSAWRYAVREKGGEQ